MLERLRTLGDQRDERKSDSDMWGPTTVEPLPPADSLIPEDHRPTIKQIPRELQRSLPRRAGSEVADGMPTSKLERVPIEPTPEPLPPQPEAEQAAASWFESVPTSPAPSIGPFGQLGDTHAGPASSITPVRNRDGTVSPGAMTRPASRARGHRVTMQLGSSPWTLTLLIAATAFAVGMVFGALLFSGNGEPAAAAADRDAGVCAPCPDPADADELPPPGDGLGD